MPLQDLTYKQIEKLARFFEPSDTHVFVLRFPFDLKPAIMKILTGIQDEPDNTSLFVYFDVPAQSADGYFSLAREDFEKELIQYEDEYKAGGVTLPPRKAEKGSFLERFVRRVDAVVAAFPKNTGSLVCLLDTGPISDSAGFATSLELLGKQAKDPRTKFVLLDEGRSEELGRLIAAGAGLDFQLRPEQIEEQVKKDLASSDLSAAERLPYLAMAGAFAFSDGRLDEATKLQTESVELAEKNGEPGDLAAGLYNLGNTHLKSKRLPEAEQCFTRAAEVSLEADNQGLLGMSLVNLGVALHRQGRTDDAVESFDAGRQVFQAQKNLPHEVFALDAKAAALAEAKRNPGAESAWREALELVDGITNSEFAELKKQSREDLVSKLTGFFESTGQKDKVRTLTAKGGA